MMRNSAVLYALLAVALPLAAVGGDGTGKMSPFVREMAGGSMAGNGLGGMSGGSISGGMKMQSRRPLMTTVFVKTGDAEAIGRAGGRMLDRRGDIWIVEMPVAALRYLAAQPSVERIEASRPASLTMDTTRLVVDALPVYEGRNLPEAFSGRGVTVGVMDVGFDLTHPNFTDPQTGRCRIGAFWDQLSPDTTGSRLYVGRDYLTPEEIKAKGCSTDGLIQTHGTHTLGCAAGSGYNAPYRGMAPGSDICLVSNAVTSSIGVIDSSQLYKFTSATDALGFKYIFDYAASCHQPCVVSFSEGYTPGYDSEDSLFAAYLERLTGPGRIIVASAGNESVHSGYVGKPADRESAGSFLRTTTADAPFYVSADGPFTLRLIAYDNGRENDTLTIAPGDTASSFALTTELADNASSFALTTILRDTLLTASVERYASAFAPADSVWLVNASWRPGVERPLAAVVSGPGSHVEMRTAGNAWFENGSAFNESGSAFKGRGSAIAGNGSWTDAETTHNILAPGCFGCVVTVGATIHRTGFVNYKGEYKNYAQTGRNDGVRSYYSSVGPAPGGLIKPDVMAPGDNVISSYSSFYLEHNPGAGDISSDVAHFDYNGRTYAWNANTGTSMAAPVVAGAVALWLEACPTLSPDDVKHIISRTSRRPDSALQYPNNYYGYGEIDVYRGLLYALGLDGISGLPTEAAAGVSATIDGGGRLVLNFGSVVDTPVGVSVYSMKGECVWRQTLRPDGTTVRIVSRTAQLPPGVYAVAISAPDANLRGSLLIRK